MFRESLMSRLLISLLLGILTAILVNEISFLFLKSESGRAPQEITFVIPAGTATRIESGEQIEIIPGGSKFVIGDKLTILNQDLADHTFGDLFIPMGSSVSTVFTQSNNYSYSCSFQSEKMLGFEVSEPVSFWLRVGGIMLAGIPLGMLYWIYGILVFPIKKYENKEA